MCYALHNTAFRLNREKRHFGPTSINYLGLVVNDSGILPLPDKLSAVQQSPEPSALKNLLSFLGLASCFRRFVPHFASIAAPLSDLVHKHILLTWEPAQIQASETIKSKLTNPPVLNYFHDDWIIDVHTDASSVGVGTTLTQKDPEGAEHVVAFASQKLSGAEKQ